MVGSFLGYRYSREICKLCFHVNAIGFKVPDDIWAAVVPSHVRDNVVCISCFARLADEKTIMWDEDIEFFPFSMASLIQDKVSAAQAVF